MAYLIVYCIFSILIILGVILGEIVAGIKPNKFQLIMFSVAPLFLPIYIGYWFANMLNPGSGGKDVITQDQAKVNINIKKP